MTAFVVFAALLGVIFGSFVNAAAWRVPRSEKLSARSRCPACDAPIRPRDLIPVVSWLVLRGRCRDCGTPIPARYPAVELVCGVLWAVVAWRLGVDAALPAALAATTGLLALSVMDLMTLRLPTRAVWTVTAVTAVGLAGAAAVDGDPARAIRAAAAGGALTLFYGTVRLVAPRGIGMGDVRLAFVVGMLAGWQGWGAAAVAAMAAPVLFVAAGVALRVKGRAFRRQRLPYGPAMAGGALIGLLAGPALWAGYLGLFGLA